MIVLHLALSCILLVQHVEGNFYFTNKVELTSLSKEEELPVGTFIIQALTNPSPADSFEISGIAATYFAINNTGRISIKQRIDREALVSTRITGTITAKRAASSPNTATADFACVITNINDNVPSYPKRLYEVSTSEDTSVGVVIFSESAVDGDASLNSKLQYSIVSSNDGGKFVVDVDTGKVSITSKLDYEQQKEYTLNITVRDPPGLSNWTILVVNVTDADDLPAKFTAFTYVGSVAEDAALGTSIFQVKANDLDKAINSAVTYRIDQDSNPSRLFAVNSSTGDITLNGTLDRETKNEYTIRVLALSSFPFSDHAAVTIQVTDVNDNKPVFTQSMYNATIKENMDPGALVVQIKATDSDQGINAKLKYSIQDGVDSNRFIIDPQNGKISTAVKLDREDKESYELTVVVQDLDGNETIGGVLNGTATVFISIKGNPANQTDLECCSGKILIPVVSRSTLQTFQPVVQVFT